MTLGSRYLVGMGIAAAISVGALALTPTGIRSTVTVAVVVGFFVQAPLGWMLVRVFGKPARAAPDKMILVVTRNFNRSFDGLERRSIS